VVGGLDALSDYVHSLGMKFGLHFVFAEADPASPVIAQHPDWTSTENSGYHGAVSLCLANQPAKDWIVRQAIRMIDDAWRAASEPEASLVIDVT
jgi:hypothetical protein